MPAESVTVAIRISLVPSTAPGRLNHCVVPAPAGMSSVSFLSDELLPLANVTAETSTVPLKGLGESFLT